MICLSYFIVYLYKENKKFVYWFISLELLFYSMLFSLVLLFESLNLILSNRNIFDEAISLNF